MSAPEELYAAILADPDDMGMRLRYADAVEGSDPEHAELIRLQIEDDAAHMAGAEVPPGHFGRRQRLEKLLAPRLGAPIAELVTSSALRRGFAELIRIPGPDFLRDGAEIYRRVPVRHVILTGVDQELVPTLAASPLLAQLSSLSLADNPIGDDGVRALLASPHLRRLRWLSLHRCRVGKTGAEVLAELAPLVLPDLQYLRFSGNPSSLVPYGEGQDAISGQHPVDVYTTSLGERVIATHGPLPWLDEKWAWKGGFVDFSQV